TLSRSRTPPVVLRGRFVPFSHSAVFFSLSLLAVLVLGGIVSDCTDTSMHFASTFGRLALAIVAVAFVLCLWDAEATFTPAALYPVGRLPLGLWLHSRSEWLPAAQRASDLGWTASLGLALYVFATAALVRFAPRQAGLWNALRLSDRREPWPLAGFLAGQAT